MIELNTALKRTALKVVDYQAEAKPKAAAKSKKLSRTRQPEGMPLAQWQAALRRQFGREQNFRLENIGGQPVFSEFRVTNPASRATYRVAIRGQALGENFCSCPDFATNTLGTCKHVEFVLGKLDAGRTTGKLLAAGYQPTVSEVYVEYGAERVVRFRPRHGAPKALLELAGKYFAEGRLQPAGFARFDTFVTQARRLDPDLEVYDDALALVAEVRDVKRRQERLAELFPRGTKSAAFNKLLGLSLYPYQREGALFAARAGRALLADDMGLGKTVQGMAVAEIMARAFGVERVLIVCPTSLKHQWEREIGRATKRSVQVIGGLRGQRRKLYRSGAFFTITNYDTVASDLPDIQALEPELVILDEAQRIKNWDTQAAKNVKQIRSPYALVLTGTPLENRLEELVSIVQFIDQHRLGPTFRFLREHQDLDENGRVVGYRGLDKISQTLAPIMLRRRKQEVLSQLPERADKNFFVPMTEQQREHHEENRDVVAKLVSKWRRFHFLSEPDQRRLRMALMFMRMSCNSTYLLDKETDYGHKCDEAAQLLEEVFESPEAKVVVFSQWLGTHELLMRRFDPRGWQSVFFHGGVSSEGRKKLIDRFRDDPACRLFLSTDAGGVGLNLQHASNVINMDLPWNPAVLEQRIGRVHRMGQKLPVQVVNFIAQGTIEEGMLSLLGFKKSLSAGILDGGEREIFLGGSRLKRFMETVDRATGSLPEQPALADEPAADSSFIRGTSERRGSPPPSPAGRAQRKGAESLHSATKETESAAGNEPLARAFGQGLALLGQLLAGGVANARPTDGAIGPLRLERDDATGRTSVSFELPPVEQLRGILEGVLKALEPQ
ncbi:MAG: DEAD/DEAH box helicase [Pirellulales bacterium]